GADTHSVPRRPGLRRDQRRSRLFGLCRRHDALTNKMGPGSATLRATLRPGHEVLASSRPFRAGLGGEVDGALDSDIVEMRIEEVARRTAAAVAQHHEKIIVGAQLAVGRELAERVVERDAM